MNAKELTGKLIPTLFDDEHLLAVVKPAGIDVGATPSGRHRGLVELLGELRGKSETLLPINRLSRFESGVLLLGKSQQVAADFRAAIKAGRIQCEYAAVVVGKSAQPGLTIDSGHGASRGQKHVRRKKKVGTSGEPSGQPSLTRVDVLHRGPKRLLIRCHTTVATTHALRAQLRAAGMRVLGDDLHDLSHRPRQVALTCLHLSKVSWFHRPTKSKVSLSSRAPEPFKAMADGEVDPLRPLHAALVRRLPCLLSRDSDACRLITGKIEGLPGLVAERYGDVAVLQVMDTSTSAPATLRAIGRWYRDVLGVRAVYVKHFMRDRVGQDERAIDAMRSEKPLVGQAVAEQITIRERGLQFAIRPYDGYSVGLFLDHRDNRQRVRALAGGRSVLNLFAYTCGFSVAAAAGGAAQTVSVDISGKHLDWGRSNFELNGLPLDEHRFICEDAAVYLKRLARREERFDLIILDPPTFAHGRKRKQGFSITRDLATLVTGALAVLSPRGILLLSSNCRTLSLKSMRDVVRGAAGRRPVDVFDTPPLPIDFEMDADHAKTLFARSC